MTIALMVMMAAGVAAWVLAPLYGRGRDPDPGGAAARRAGGGEA